MPKLEDHDRDPETNSIASSRYQRTYSTFDSGVFDNKSQRNKNPTETTNLNKSGLWFNARHYQKHDNQETHKDTRDSSFGYQQLSGLSTVSNNRRLPKRDSFWYIPSATSSTIYLSHTPPDIREYAPRSNTRNIFGVRMSNWNLCFYFCFYVVFLACGAMVFAYFEAPGEQRARMQVNMVKMNFLQDYPCVSEAALERLVEAVVAANNQGVSAAKNVSSEPNWSFGQSLFFSSTVVTTIGYGHVTPLSKEGKVFCMLYALIGIPLTLVLLTALIERLLDPGTWLLQWLNEKLGHLYQPFNIKLLHLLIIVSIVSTLFLVIPAAIFAHLEPDWDYLDSLYYCFISLTTIGLGDYIPGDSPNQPYRPLYKILTTVYLFAGLVAIMFMMTVFYDIPQLNLGILFTVPADKATTEKLHLATGAHLHNEYGTSTGIAPELDGHHAVVRVRSRRDDSPSPEDFTPVHAKHMFAR